MFAERSEGASAAERPRGPDLRQDAICPGSAVNPYCGHALPCKPWASNWSNKAPVGSPILWVHTRVGVVPTFPEVTLDGRSGALYLAKQEFSGTLPVKLDEQSRSVRRYVTNYALFT